ncbi:MAG: hypothetical protein JW725_02600 [Candidatus Babeliaceae bacterium]|nr:hypothetical protein [Candidatus Babeliaceae bacterium]
MAKRWGKNYFCTVVSENVEISLRNKASIGRKYKRELFVLCNQSECQYVKLNQSPCPLSLDLFAKEIEEREQKLRDSRM